MAVYYFRNAGVNWSDAANWSLTDGGGATGAVPTAADDALFTANSGNCTVNASNRVCKTLNFTGYTNTITMTFGITVSGSVTLVAAMTIAGASGLTINATGTFTSNGKTWPNALTFSATNTLTLADDLNITGLLTISGATTVNGTFNINVNGGITLSANIAKGTGTPVVNLLGGTWSGGSAFAIDVNINGNITVSGSVIFGTVTSTPTLTYTSGTVTVTGSTLNIVANTGQAVTLNTGGMTWNNVSYGAATAFLTLLSNLNIGGVFTTTGNQLSVNGSFNINCFGGISIGLSLVQGTGTTTLNLLGGTWSSGTIRINTVINGNITISGSVGYSTGTLTYTSGEANTGGSTLTLSTPTPTLNTSGMYWNNVTGVCNLTSDINILGLFSTFNGGFSGAFNVNLYGGISIGNFLQNSTVAVPTINLYGGVFCPTAPSDGFYFCNINILGNVTLGNIILRSTNTIRYISGITKGTNNSSLSILVNGNTIVNADRLNGIKTITIGGALTVTMNKFFSGSALIPTRIQSSTTANYIIVFQDGFEKITKFTKISNCTVTRRNQLLCITDKSNKGGNVGVRYINQMPNGIAENAPTTANPMAYGLPSFLDSDPNFIIN